MKTKKRLFSKRLIAIMLTAFMATTAAFAAQRSLEEMKSIAYAAFNLDNTRDNVKERFDEEVDNELLDFINHKMAFSIIVFSRQKADFFAVFTIGA